nr:putative polyprotein [Tanacetum cinerariifolium]
MKDSASWDLDNNTWEGWGEVIGTVLVICRCTGESYGGEGVLAGKVVMDAEHVGCQDTRRSTSGSAKFLGDKLVI